MTTTECDDTTTGAVSENERYTHPLDAFVNDPTGMRPLCDEELFAEVAESMVADEAPKLFALVQEYGERVDCRVAGWGMDFGDHAEVVAVDRSLRMSLRRPEDASRMFGFGSHIHARLVWFNPDAATPEDEDGSAE